MANGLCLHPSRISATKGWHIAGTVVGLGNHCSIRLSYGANGGFPRFPPRVGQTETRKRRKGGMVVKAREAAQLVPQRFHRGPTVYFVGGDEGPVKIGFTTEMPLRLRNLANQSAHPIKLLAAIAGGRDLEKRYHAKFADDRLHGEWFKRSEAVEGELAKLRWMPGVLYKFGREYVPQF
jgi:hypothetical protein